MEAGSENFIKVLFAFEEDGETQIESLWAAPKGNYFEIRNIPFLIPNIAWGDIISIENINGELWFDDIIQESGHTTIQIVFLDITVKDSLVKTIEGLGATWEGSHLDNLIAVDVLPEVDYQIIKAFLDIEEAKEKISYKEACLSNKHRSD